MQQKDSNVRFNCNCFRQAGHAQKDFTGLSSLLVFQKRNTAADNKNLQKCSFEKKARNTGIDISNPRDEEFNQLLSLLELSFIL